jgi:UDP-N-acetylmuramoyl-L-alanyl-D-glutamate--2,6-diaminopimelate ligase
MEVSSHALAQSRVEGVHFDVAVFTNLSHDHLDYHGSMDAYFEAKAELFGSRYALRGVINADDPWGRRLLEAARIPVTPVHHADASDIVLLPGGTQFTWRGQRITTTLTGSVNVDNVLLAAEAALALDVPLEEVTEALPQLTPVPGRLQIIAAGLPGLKGEDVPPFTVLVDYAHTPAGLEVVLREAKALAPDGRVLVVFGCGGNRDRAKRPLMGEAAAQLSDEAFVTSDNPREEDPVAIIDEVVSGIAGGRENAAVHVDADRRTAIRNALERARPGDVVVIAGKGHETYQEVKGKQFPFDDAVEARTALSARFGSDPGSWVSHAMAGRSLSES